VKLLARSCTVWLKHIEATRNHLLDFSRLAETLGVLLGGSHAFLLQPRSRSLSSVGRLWWLYQISAGQTTSCHRFRGCFPSGQKQISGKGCCHVGQVGLRVGQVRCLYLCTRQAGKEIILLFRIIHIQDRYAGSSQLLFCFCEK